MQTIHSILAMVLSQDAMQALGDIWAAALLFITALAALIGFASKMVVALKVLARIFKGWAERTEMKADDNAAMFFAVALDFVGAVLDWCRAKVEPFALNKAGDGKGPK
jgi:hypothetical protein